jgi:anti-sigma factor RsiW
MNCRRAEDLLVRLSDGPLGPDEAGALREHLAGCPACRRLDGAYALIRDAVRAFPRSEPKPLFAERVVAKLPAAAPPVSTWAWPSLRRIGLKLVPAYLAVVIVLGAALAFLRPPAGAELSLAEILLRGEDPLNETATILDEPRGEDRNMRILFASLDRNPSPGRQMP